MKNEVLKEKQARWEKEITFPLGVCGILFVLDLIFIQNLTQTSDLPVLRLLSLIFFLLALPLLGCNSFAHARMATLKTPLPGQQRLLCCTQIGSYVASWLGVLLSVWYVSWIASAIFFLVSVFALALASASEKQLEITNQPPPIQQ